MAFPEQLSQALSIPIASLFPTNQGSATTNNTITAIPIKNFRRLMAHAMIGLGTSSVLTCYWCGCNTSNGTYVALTQNASNTTLVLSGVNTEGTLEVRADQFNLGNQFAQLTMTLTTQNANIAATVYGGECEYKPASQYDWALTGGSRVVVGN